MTAVGATNLSGERITFFERGMLPKSSGIAEGFVVVHTSDTDDNLIVDLPTAATALLGGRAFAGISASALTTTVSSNTLPSDNEISVQKAGVANCQLKANTACVRGSWAAYDPADGGYIVPWTSGAQVPIGLFTQTKSSSASAQFVGVWLQQSGGLSEILLGNIITSSAALSANAETVFNKSVSIPANWLQAGDALRIRAKARVTAGATADTLVIRVRLGSAAGVLLAVSTSIDPAADALINFNLEGTIRTSGASGTIEVSGNSVAATSALSTGTAGTVAIDTTVANSVVVTADWSADTADTVVLEHLSVSLLRAAS